MGSIYHQASEHSTSKGPVHIATAHAHLRPPHHNTIEATIATHPGPFPVQTDLQEPLESHRLSHRPRACPTSLIRGGNRQDRVSIQGSGARYDGHAAREGGDTGPRPASSIRPRCGAMRLHLAMHLAMHGRSSGRTWKGEGKGGEGWVDGGNGERSCHGRVFGWGKAKRRTGEGNRWSLLLRRLADRETPVTMR